MLLFCPHCSNLLVISRTPTHSAPSPADAQKNRFECKTCPYQKVITQRLYFDPKVIKSKEVDDIVGGAAAWENADQIDVRCTDEKCPGERAFWYQLQIRSADEPMTQFFKCTTCGHRWRE